MAMPYGAALCVVELYDCVATGIFNDGNNANPMPLTEAERDLGDYTPGRFAWLTRNLRVLSKPVPVRGRQGIWNLEPAEAAAVAAALAGK
jgi:hypothetical protein